MAANIKVRVCVYVEEHYIKDEYYFIPLLMWWGDIFVTVAHLDENCECCEMTAMTGPGSLGGLCWQWGTTCCKFGTGVSSEASPQGGQTGWGQSE